MEENPKDFVRSRIRTSDRVSEGRHSPEEVWRRGRRCLRGCSLPSPLSLPPGSDEHFKSGFFVAPGAAARLAARTLAVLFVLRRPLAVLVDDPLWRVTP